MVLVVWYRHYWFYGWCFGTCDISSSIGTVGSSDTAGTVGPIGIEGSASSDAFYVVEANVVC